MKKLEETMVLKTEKAVLAIFPSILGWFVDVVSALLQEGRDQNLLCWFSSGMDSTVFRLNPTRQLQKQIAKLTYNLLGEGLWRI